MPYESLLTSNEVAKRLQVSVGRVHQFVMEGRLVYDRKLGRNSLFSREEVERFARQKRSPGRPKKIA